MREFPNKGNLRKGENLQLQDLQNENHLLKESLQKGLEEKARMEMALAKLNQFSVELLNLSPLENLESVISRMVKTITGAKASVFSSYDPESRLLNVQHIELEPGLLDRVLSLVGTQIRKISAPVDEETYRLMTTEVIGVRKTLHEASFGSISKPVGNAVQKLLNVDRFIGIVYMIDGRFYGTSLLAMGKGVPDPSRQILENIIFLASVTLKRKEAEEAIKDSESRFRLLFETSSNALFLTHPVSRKILYANKAASALLMRKNEEITGLNHYELHSHQTADYTRIAYDRLLNESEFLGFTRPFESTIIRSDGQHVPVEISVQMVQFKGQQLILTSLHDMSERKQAEQAMRQILTELQTLIDNMQQGVLLEDENRNVQYVNEKFCELIGVESTSQVQGQNCKELMEIGKYQFANPDEFVEKVEERLRNKKPVLSEEVFLANGRIIERDYIPVLVDGKSMKNYWIFRDVTERKQSENSLRESQSQISALLKAIPDMLFIQNPEGVYIDYHVPKGDYLVMPPEFFLHKNMKEILPPDLAEKFRQVLDNALETGSIQNLEYSLDLNGQTNYFESRTIAYADDKLLSLVRNISERKEAELKIKMQLQELEKLNEDKDRFMSILAHDLKSPFNSILGLLKLLSENFQKYDVAKSQKLINTVRQSSEHFYQLLVSLLLWARSQSGKMPFEPVRVNFSKLCNELIDEVKLNAESKNISIHLVSDEDRNVSADVEMLKTILRNLISNAIKFTERGGKIEIGIRDFKDFVEIEVADNGIGISAGQAGTLFDISGSQNLTGTAGETGTGLGLFLCRELVAKHGGTIRVESTQGEGSRFVFTLPQYHS